MIAEHAFVTKLPWPETLVRLRAFLQAAGFRELSLAENLLEAGRGRRQPQAGKIRDLPQLLRIEYDRGLVSAAVEIRTHDGRDRPALAPLVTTLLEALESFLLGAPNPEQAVAAWQTMLANSGRVHSSATLGCLIILAALTALVLLMIHLH